MLYGDWVLIARVGASMRPPRNAGEMLLPLLNYDVAFTASMRPPRNAGEMTEADDTDTLSDLSLQ